MYGVPLQAGGNHLSRQNLVWEVRYQALPSTPNGERRVMARCGRCGLYQPYPEDYPETAVRGVCLWSRLRVPGDAVFDPRPGCSEFFEKIPGLEPMAQFKYHLERSGLRENYLLQRRSLYFSSIALVISLITLLSRLF